MPPLANSKPNDSKPSRSLGREMLALVFVYALVFVVSLSLANGCSAERANAIAKIEESRK
ncbi:MAG: hypothetical protein ACKVS6_07845 [Planctomycetota bacterium]